MPTNLQAESVGQQTPLLLQLQNAQTGNANGDKVDATGYKSLYAEVIEGNVGTSTLTFEGSFDGTNWFSIWSAPTTANGRTFVATVSVAQNTRTWNVLQDGAPWIRARTSGNSGSVTVNLYGTPI